MQWLRHRSQVNKEPAGEKYTSVSTSVTPFSPLCLLSFISLLRLTSSPVISHFLCLRCSLLSIHFGVFYFLTPSCRFENVYIRTSLGFRTFFFKGSFKLELLGGFNIISVQKLFSFFICNLQDLLPPLVFSVEKPLWKAITLYCNPKRLNAFRPVRTA